MKILIIGYGVVGQNMHKIFPEATVIDPNEGIYPVSDDETYDVGFICVPTEMLPDGKADVSIVLEAIAEHQDCEVLCIKSAVPPGTTQPLIDEGRRIVVSPEYFGATQHANAVDYDFVILGGRLDDTIRVALAYQEVKAAGFRIDQTDATTVELVKYMENAWIATKVTFCNEFANIAQAFGVHYSVLRELWLADPRVNPSHTFVYPDAPGWDSHCLNKDIPAIIAASRDAGYQPYFLQVMVMANNANMAARGGKA